MSTNPCDCAHSLHMAVPNPLTVGRHRMMMDDWHDGEAYPTTPHHVDDVEAYPELHHTAVQANRGQSHTTPRWGGE